LPSGQRAFPGTVATESPFIGCIGDATVNGVFINFANATDRIGAILGKCPSADQPPAEPSRPSGICLLLSSRWQVVLISSLSQDYARWQVGVLIWFGIV
jgi:hypothetical protein